MRVNGWMEGVRRSCAGVFFGGAGGFDSVVVGGLRLAPHGRPIPLTLALSHGGERGYVWLHSSAWGEGICVPALFGEGRGDMVASPFPRKGEGMFFRLQSFNAGGPTAKLPSPLTGEGQGDGEWVDGGCAPVMGRVVLRRALAASIRWWLVGCRLGPPMAARSPSP